MKRIFTAICMVTLWLILSWKFGFLVSLWTFLICAYTYLFSGIGKVQFPVQSVNIGKARPKQGAPRVNVEFRKGLLNHPEGVETLYENFQAGLKNARHKPCLAHRPSPSEGFVSETYEQVDKRIKNFGSGLINIGIKPNDRIGFYAKNCREWVIGAEACNAYSLTSVAIYDTLGIENREYVVSQSEIVAICTTKDHLQHICELKKSESCSNLKIVIFMDNLDEQMKQATNNANLDAYLFSELETLGSEKPVNPIPPKPSDLAILMYTSGTTSRPKGVMITHANVVAAIAGVINSVPPFTPTDRYLSYLPLAHILERVAEAAMFNGGAAVGFYQGDIRKLSDDITTWKPTIYAGVPKVYQRMMNSVKQQIAKSPKHIQLVFSFCYHLKLKCLELGIPTGFLDATVFKKTRAGLGGQCKLLVSGGAPLGAECHQFLTVCFGPTVQGYGLTETCGGGTVVPYKLVDRWEKVGVPVACSSVKLIDSGKYSSDTNPPQGEVCISGANVALGYYKQPEKTAEAFVEEDGQVWFRTGDAGQWNHDGTLSIIGRVKDIFKLDSGEYIAPERLETIYSQSKLVSNVFVYGNSDKSNVVAVVVPDVAAAKHWAKANNVSYSPDVPEPNVPPEICANKQFNQAVLDDLKRVAQEAQLNSYEMIPVVHLDGLFWTPDTGLVTDAMKNKRESIYQQYEQPIKELYSQLKQ